MSGEKSGTTNATADAETHNPEENSMMVHVLAPLAAIGATWAVRKALNSSYRSVTGRSAPNPQDVNGTWGSALMWAALTAASAAVVEVAVYRYLAKKA
jgi:anti-sigma-K factor RskA